MIARELVWRPHTTRTDVASGPYHVYFAQRQPEGRCRVDTDDEESLGEHATEAEAKAAAQRHADEVVAGMLSDDALGLLKQALARTADQMGAALDYALCDRILSNRKGGAG